MGKCCLLYKDLNFYTSYSCLWYLYLKETILQTPFKFLLMRYCLSSSSEPSFQGCKIENRSFTGRKDSSTSSFGRQRQYLLQSKSQACLLSFINDSGSSPVIQLTVFTGITWSFPHHLMGFKGQGRTRTRTWCYTSNCCPCESGSTLSLTGEPHAIYQHPWNWLASLLACKQGKISHRFQH